MDSDCDYICVISLHPVFCSTVLLLLCAFGVFIVSQPSALCLDLSHTSPLSHKMSFSHPFQFESSSEQQNRPNMENSINYRP
ncbi:hypothetical protein BJY01DRAFT_214504, partial [Aspergillus pseudoustus]